MFINVLLYAAVTILALFLVFWLIGENGRLMRSSTWAGLKAQGLRGMLNFQAMHMYLYGRWPAKYLHVLFYKIYPRLSRSGHKWWADRYHGKVLTVEHANAIITLNRDLELRDLEKIIPYPMARDLVLSGPLDVVALECPCRNAKEDHCTPTQVCLTIGKPFTDFVLQHTPDKARRITRDEALEIIEAEHKKGHVHSAWFKDALLGRFYSLCNCCKCCCCGINGMTKFNNGSMCSSGYVASIKGNRCKSCKVCADACPFGAISIENKPVVNREKCMGCGVCASQCPAGCIDLIRDESKGIPLDVRQLV